MPEWGPGYLEALDECRGRALDAAKAMGMDHSTVYKARQKYPELDHAYQDSKALWDDIVMEGLEAKSIDEAMNKSVVERIFHQKARNPSKYREKAISLGPQHINITFGFPFPALPKVPHFKDEAGTDSGMEIQAEDAEVNELSSNTRKRRHPPEDILSADDLDI